MITYLQPKIVWNLLEHGNITKNGLERIEILVLLRLEAPFALLGDELVRDLESLLELRTLGLVQLRLLLLRHYL